MRYVIVGTGAIGGMLGGSLARAGRDSVWVARGEHGRTLAAQGMTLRTPAGTDQLRAPVWSGPEEADLRPGDVLVIATKTHQVPQALTEWADLPVEGATAGERLPVLLATNGVASEDMALRYFRRVYGVCVWSPVTQVRPGEVVASFTPTSAVLHLGRVPAGLTDAQDTAFLDEVSADWEAAGLSVPRPVDVMAWKYRKLITNIGNIFGALLGQEVRTDLQDDAEAEARRVLADAGIEVVDDATEQDLRENGPTPGTVPGAPDQLGSSTWQSMVKGRGSLETDYLNGEISYLAARHGLPAPINTRLASVARRAAAAGLAPGDLTEADLRP